jgi:hypothetical protein
VVLWAEKGVAMKLRKVVFWLHLTVGALAGVTIFGIAGSAAMTAAARSGGW